MSDHEPLDTATIAIVEKYGNLLTNTGDNDPLRLLRDLQPFTDGRPNRLMVTDVVRFVLAVGVQAQVALLRVLIANEHPVADHSVDPAQVRGSSEIMLVYHNADGDEHTQTLNDITDAGILIDPETGDDVELVGWRFARTTR